MKIYRRIDLSINIGNSRRDIEFLHPLKTSLFMGLLILCASCSSKGICASYCHIKIYFSFI